MPEAIRKVNVIGHLNPDTDSICAAISYAYLKNKIDSPIYEARRAGTLNRETAFVLKHFGFEEPQLITTVTPQIKDAEIQKQPKVDGDMSLFDAWLPIALSTLKDLSPLKTLRTPIWVLWSQRCSPRHIPAIKTFSPR